MLPQGQIEKNYIDSLLDVEQFDNNEKSDTNTGVQYREELADTRLYQLLLVDGMKFAVALPEISQAVDYSNVDIKNDILLYDDIKLTIVNLVALIRPNDKTLTIQDDSKKYLLIPHRRLAIECHQVLEIEKINEDVVCWQNEKSQRKWLAGTVKTRGIAILDLAILQKG